MARRKPSTGLPASAFMAQGFNGGTREPLTQPEVRRQLLVDSQTFADLLAACEAAREELRLLRMKDTDAVYDPTLSTRLDVAIAKARGGAS